MHCLRLHEPVSGGMVLRIDKPWEGAGELWPMSVTRTRRPAADRTTGAGTLTDPADQNRA